MEISKILFVEPPKEYWFLMGEYLPPPAGLLTLAAYVEREIPEMEVEVLDCQAEEKSWKDVEKYIESYEPLIVAVSGFTCNAYACARTAEIAKKVNKEILTFAGGQHFTFTAGESLLNFPEIDFIVRGEGELTLAELIKAALFKKNFLDVKGVSFRKNGEVFHTPERPLIENLDILPYPAYHLVEKNLKKYHFTMMAGKKARYMIMEGARGCSHRCSFCTQWRHWGGAFRAKSAERIAGEMQYLRERFGGDFFWLTDDNFDYKKRAFKLWEEMKKNKFSDGVTWFFQARADDISENPGLVAKLSEVGNRWILVGVENNSQEVLKDFNKEIRVNDSVKAVKTLKENDIFSQAMFVIGSRGDTHKSIENLRQFSLELDAELSIYTILTPYPGTEVYKKALANNWIEDLNYAHYDMVHAIMPAESLSRKEVQEELYLCYRSFYGSSARNIKGFFSKNRIKRRAYRHMAGQNVLKSLRNII